jgi:hypothetical protein
MAAAMALPVPVAAPPFRQANPAAEDTQARYSLETDNLPDDAPDGVKSLFYALATYRGLWPYWFPPDAPKRLENRNREDRMLEAMPMLGISSMNADISAWESAGMLRLMHGHVSCLFDWHRHLRKDPATRTKIPPPPAPLTMVDLVADAFPSFDGLRAFHFMCAPVQPEDVLNAVRRRMR